MNRTKNIMNRKKNIRLIQNRLLNKELWYNIVNIEKILFNNEYYCINNYNTWYLQILSKNSTKWVYYVDSYGDEQYNE